MNKKEKVIFLTDVKGVAKKGEIKEVGGTFAKNFLLPKQKALIYNKVISTQLQYHKAKLEEQQTLKKNKEKETFTSIRERKLNFFLKERDGQTFGSITALDIVRVLEKEFNVQINKEMLLNFKPLHKKGVFPVEVKIGKNLITNLQVIVRGIRGNLKTQ